MLESAGGAAAAGGKRFSSDALKLLDGVPLPPLHGSYHFVNLTNGIEALPMLHRLGLPYSFVRICSTDIEQQNYEALITGLDANLLMHLAMGHRRAPHARPRTRARVCCVWDLGSRNKKRGAPRAVWAGLEFVRWCLESKWLQAGGAAPAAGSRDGGGLGSGSGSESDGGGSEGGTSSGSSSGSGSGGDGPQAHLRGHRVTATFEAHRRRFSQSTKRRLLYYRRYVPEDTRRLQLYGVYRPTTNDSNQQYYVEMARAWDAPLGSATHLPEAPALEEARAAAGGAAAGPLPSDAAGAGGAALSSRDRAAWGAIAADGWGVFAGGLGHAEYFSALQLLGAGGGGGESE
ncbi:MAG: hypothetical protein J3K34DRAFT_520273 [Monoraphidium minutum]|nr:MAG: hypothetical protein J3K34DRAFT_520273 [Monoraphidium minutum]